jgi:guanidinoacetate N-methyltransferase
MNPLHATDDVLTEDERAIDTLRAMYGEVGFVPPAVWVEAPAQLHDDTLTILGHPVMETWEDPYMRKLAAIATRNGGRVLEIGFGMGRSARFIHQNAGVTEHVIVEANREVAERARAFAAGAGIRVTVIQGLRDEVLPDLEPGSFDGMLNDTYPLHESEVNAQEHCARSGYRVLRKGGVLTYFSDEPNRFRRRHLQVLVEAGFMLENITGELVRVTPPATCRYWNVGSILAPIVVK